MDVVENEKGSVSTSPRASVTQTEPQAHGRPLTNGPVHMGIPSSPLSVAGGATSSSLSHSPALSTGPLTQGTSSTPYFHFFSADMRHRARTGGTSSRVDHVLSPSSSPPDLSRGVLLLDRNGTTDDVGTGGGAQQLPPTLLAPTPSHESRWLHVPGPSWTSTAEDFPERKRQRFDFRWCRREDYWRRSCAVRGAAAAAAAAAEASEEGAKGAERKGSTPLSGTNAVLRVLAQMEPKASVALAGLSSLQQHKGTPPPFHHRPGGEEVRQTTSNNADGEAEMNAASPSPPAAAAHTPLRIPAFFSFTEAEYTAVMAGKHHTTGDAAPAMMSPDSRNPSSCVASTDFVFDYPSSCKLVTLMERFGNVLMVRDRWGITDETGLAPSTAAQGAGELENTSSPHSCETMAASKPRTISIPSTEALFAHYHQLTYGILTYRWKLLQRLLGQAEIEDDAAREDHHQEGDTSVSQRVHSELEMGKRELGEDSVTQHRKARKLGTANPVANNSAADRLASTRRKSHRNEVSHPLLTCIQKHPFLHTPMLQTATPPSVSRRLSQAAVESGNQALQPPLPTTKRELVDLLTANPTALVYHPVTPAAVTAESTTTTTTINGNSSSSSEPPQKQQQDQSSLVLTEDWSCVRFKREQLAALLRLERDVNLTLTRSREAYSGLYPRAAELLKRAEGVCKPPEWLSTDDWFPHSGDADPVVSNTATGSPGNGGIGSGDSTDGSSGGGAVSGEAEKLMQRILQRVQVLLAEAATKKEKSIDNLTTATATTTTTTPVTSTATTTTTTTRLLSSSGFCYPLPAELFSVADLSLGPAQGSHARSASPSSGAGGEDITTRPPGGAEVASAPNRNLEDVEEDEDSNDDDDNDVEMNHAEQGGKGSAGAGGSSAPQRTAPPVKRRKRRRNKSPKAPKKPAAKSNSGGAAGGFSEGASSSFAEERLHLLPPLHSICEEVADTLPQGSFMFERMAQAGWLLPALPPLQLPPPIVVDGEGNEHSLEGYYTGGGGSMGGMSLVADLTSGGEAVGAPPPPPSPVGWAEFGSEAEAEECLRVLKQVHSSGWCNRAHSHLSEVTLLSLPRTAGLPFREVEEWLEKYLWEHPYALMDGDHPVVGALVSQIRVLMLQNRCWKRQVQKWENRLLEAMEKLAGEVNEQCRVLEEDQQRRRRQRS